MIISSLNRTNLMKIWDMGLGIGDLGFTTKSKRPALADKPFSFIN